MAAFYKLDDGQCYPTNCFPAKSLLQPRYEEGAGHWQVARHNVEKTKVEWLFGSRVVQESWQECLWKAQRSRPEKVLNGARLMKLHHVQKPSDLCSVNISHQNFALAKESDFMQFDSVAYINATENLLTLETFRNFPGLRELELSLNGLRNLKVRIGDFPHLEILDLSYNNLSPEDVRTLGMLPHLKALHLTANGLSSLPLNLAFPDSRNCPRFPALEVLLLDDNQLSDSSVFLSLANLRRLKQLNLDKNGIKEVPYLHYLGQDHFSIHPLSAKSGIREGLRCRKKSPQKSHQDRSPRLNQQYSYIITQNTQDPDKTEVVFQARPPEETAQERPPSPLEDSKAPCPNEFLLPLPELRFLSLANNQIENEEDLLAVALFPSLTELIFYGNPFTTSRSGDPPLLTSFLQDKLGIKLVRKKVSKLEKPRVFIPVKANREIKSKLPKIHKKRLPVDVALETTFWQLWTGADLDPNQTLSSPAVEGSRSFLLSYDPNQRILSPLRPEERSADLSLSSLYGGTFSPGSSLEGISFGSDLLLESSLEHILARKASASPTWSGQSPSEGLPSRLPSRGPPGLSSPSSGPCEPEGTESRPYLRTPSGERLPETQLEPLTPPNSPSEEQDGSDVVQIVEPEEGGGGEEEKEKEEEEEEETKTLSSTASGGEATQSAPITTSLPDQKGSEPRVSSSFEEEEDLGEPPSPARSLSVDKDLLSRGSSAENQDRQESVPTSYPSGEDLAQGQLDQQRIPAVVLTTVSSEVEYGDQEEPPQLSTSGFQDVNLLESSEEEEHPRLASSPLVEYGQEERPTSEDLCSSRRSTLVLPSRSVSGELYKLFAQIQSYALPLEPEEDAFTEEEEEEVLTRSREGTTEPIFITQVKESLDSGRSHLSLGKVTLNVPEKLKGYEELLGGDPGSDFVEPKGIQQNVQALEQALRYPLIYREGKARLDGYQKPYVSAKKKVLRIPAPKLRKTRMERLEEILLELRKPRNVVHIPLVCILRRRKENWREYREALELLKEFQKDYKSMVANCNKIAESRAIGKDQVPKTGIKPIPKFRSLPEIKGRSKSDESPIQILQEKKDPLPSHQ